MKPRSTSEKRGELNVGSVNVWEVPGYRLEVTPFGGIKDSGTGVKEGVQECCKAFTNLKTYSLPWWAAATKERPMLVGVPKEIKNHEYRVGLTPGSVRELTAHGHAVLVQAGAGAGIGAADAEYLAAGASIAASAAEVFGRAEMIVKVKEPQAGERAMLVLQHNGIVLIDTAVAQAAGSEDPAWRSKNHGSHR